MSECILCYEEAEIFGIGKCNHNEICFHCIIKSRSKMKNKSCPICKENQDIIILSSEAISWNEANQQNIKLYGNPQEGIFYFQQNILDELNKLNQYKCWVKGCTEQATFNSVGFLKRHLKDRHQRFLCDICLENKTALLVEQKLYTQREHQKHLEKGDQDEDGNIIFLHPYCQFCKQYFFNEEILQKHLIEKHFQCQICGDEFKYRWYNQYKNMETHFKITHYMCQDPECQQKGFVVYKTQSELEFHLAKVHCNYYDKTSSKHHQKAMNNFNLQALTGFSFGDDSHQQKSKDDKIRIKDQEGVDFENQFLSQRKSKMRAITDKDLHQDESLDIRDFYKTFYDDLNEDEDDLYFQKVLKEAKMIFENKLARQQQQQIKENEPKGGQGRQQSQRGGRQQGGRGGYQKPQEVQYQPKMTEEEEIILNEMVYLEDFRLIKYKDIKQMPGDFFDRKIEKVLMHEVFDHYFKKKNEYFKSKINAEAFLKVFIEVLGKKIALQLFPFFITTISSDQIQQDLDREYYKELIKLPKKNENLIKMSNKYSDFFKLFREEIEKNIRARVENGLIDLNKKYLMDHIRICQLIEILRRVKTTEMAKLKFSTNFGLPVEIIEIIKRKILFLSLGEIQQELLTIPTEDFFPLYLYIRLCYDLLIGVKLTEKSKQITYQDLLNEFCMRNPDLVQKYKRAKKNEDDEEDEDLKDISELQYIGPKVSNYKPQFYQPKAAIDTIQGTGNIMKPQQLQKQAQKQQNADDYLYPSLIGQNKPLNKIPTNSQKQEVQNDYQITVKKKRVRGKKKQQELEKDEEEEKFEEQEQAQIQVSNEVIEQVLEAKQPIKQISTKSEEQQIQQQTEQKKVFDQSDVFEFPSLSKDGTSTQSKQKSINTTSTVTNYQSTTSHSAFQPQIPVQRSNQTKKINSTSGWDSFKTNPLYYQSLDPSVNLKKIINEDFPSLESKEPVKQNVPSQNDKWGNFMFKTNTQKDDSEMAGKNNQNKVQKQDKQQKKYNDDDDDFYYKYEDNGKQEQEDVIGHKGKGKKAKQIYAGGFW